MDQVNAQGGSERPVLTRVIPPVCALCLLAEIVGNPELDRSSWGTMIMLNMACYKAAARGTGPTDWILFSFFPKIKQSKQNQFHYR